MCTCIDFQTKNHYFGRNLDLEYRFNESVAITPRNYRFPLKNGTAIRTRYAMTGIASVIENYPLYAEASNEKGLSMAGLYFPGNARFFPEKQDRLNLAPYELMPYFLGLFSHVAEIREVLADLNITDRPFSDDLPLTELHWMMSDEKECIVLEQTRDGLHIYDNPAGVMTNNPVFPYHMTNLNNYLNLTPHYAENRFADSLPLQPYGNGMGAVGLPGDASSASRFVRAAFHKANSLCDEDEESSVTQFFHILDSVAMVRGATITKDGKADFTVYSCCINTSQGIYYYKTYANNQITAIKMTEDMKNKKELSLFPLLERQQIRTIREQ